MMVDLPEHNMAHKPGPDVPDDLPPVPREEMDRDELDERVSDAVDWMRRVIGYLPQDSAVQRGLRVAIDSYEQEGWL